MQLKDIPLIIFIISEYLIGVGFIFMAVLMLLGYIEAGFISGGVSVVSTIYFCGYLLYKDLTNDPEKAKENNQEKPHKKIVIDIKLDNKNSDNSK